MRKCLLLLACAGLCAAADAPQTYIGTVGDDMCSGDHKMMGGTDAAKCTNECVSKMHSKYALWAGKDVYILSEQKTGPQYAGKKVKVTGTLSSTGTGAEKVTTLKVNTIALAN